MFKKIILAACASCAAISLFAQAVVFDFGGVMTGEPNREAVVRFLQDSFKLTQEEFNQLNQEKRKVIKNGKTDAEFWLGYAKEKNIILPQDWVQNFEMVMREAIGVNQEMYDLVHELKEKGVRIALLSNIDPRLSKIIRDFGLYEPFDPCLLSWQMGIEKPDPKIYEILLKEMDLPAEEILFVDDKSENIEAAKKLGFDAILFLSHDQFHKELKSRRLI